MHIGVHPYSSPGRGVLSVITRYCCWRYFIYYQFIITDNHFFWKVNITFPIRGIIFLCLSFAHMSHINFPSVNERSVCSGSLVWSESYYFSRMFLSSGTYSNSSPFLPPVIIVSSQSLPGSTVTLLLDFYFSLPTLEFLVKYKSFMSTQVLMKSDNPSVKSQDVLMIARNFLQITTA